MTKIYFDMFAKLWANYVLLYKRHNNTLFLELLRAHLNIFLYHKCTECKNFWMSSSDIDLDLHI